MNINTAQQQTNRCRIKEKTKLYELIGQPNTLSHLLGRHLLCTYWNKLIIIMCLYNGFAAVDYLQCTENMPKSPEAKKRTVRNRLLTALSILNFVQWGIRKEKPPLPASLALKKSDIQCLVDLLTISCQLFNIVLT
ncbi:hypothetical protein NQ318_008747 [Aromia moschata]|uniref:Uncharacterized protein n=1 Tax=Aromia moschata TaxID=1265417 RepID=A0AAV8Y1E1_9CUCU|nr:hypothetical protein NQ318_008747 [Aromia moschata]